MAKPDPALGISADFDADLFRNAIHFAMQMGAPPDPERQCVFVFGGTGRTYWQDGVQIATPRVDRDGRPLDPTIETRDTPGSRVTVDCAIEVERADSEELPVGNFRPTKAVITLLDEEYAQVQGCRELLYNGDRYLFGYEPEAPGLFEVGTYSMVFYALDET